MARGLRQGHTAGLKNSNRNDSNYDFFMTLTENAIDVIKKMKIHFIMVY